jgi:2-C-methyl-D-erythritol 4-phosphate cytidylyltransferase
MISICPVLLNFAGHLWEEYQWDSKLAELFDTRVPPSVELRRAYVLTNEAARVFVPIAMEKAGAKKAAKKLRKLPTVQNAYTAKRASKVLMQTFKAAAGLCVWTDDDEPVDDAAMKAAFAAINASKAADLLIEADASYQRQETPDDTLSYVAQHAATSAQAAGLDSLNEDASVYAFARALLVVSDD